MASKAKVAAKEKPGRLVYLKLDPDISETIVADARVAGRAVSVHINRLLRFALSQPQTKSEPAVN
jgi:hypothetical protein